MKIPGLDVTKLGGMSDMPLFARLQAVEAKMWITESSLPPLIAESSGIMAQLVWADDQPLVSK